MFCNLNALARVIDFANCIDEFSLRCCPLCMKENPFPGAWEPLIWSIEPVVACPKHRVLLVSPECGSRREHWHDVFRRCLVPGVCRYCGSVGFECSRLITRRATNNQVWFAEQVGTLISAASSGKEFVMPVATAALTKRIKDRFGTIAEAERTCGFSDRYLDKKLGSGRRLGLQQMLILCGRLQADVLPVLRGEVVDAESPHVSSLSGQWSRKPRSAERPTREMIEAAISDDPAISINGLCERMKIKQPTLERWFPDIFIDLRAGSADRKGRARWRTLLRRGRELRGASRDLANAGLAFTWKNVVKQCGIHLDYSSSRDLELFKRRRAKVRAGKA